jgi:hypothetical protein
LVAGKLADAAVRWLKRVRQTDDLSRLVKAAAGTSVQLSQDEFKDLGRLLEKEETWRLLAGGRLHEKLQELTSKIADCLPARSGQAAEDASEAAGAIARGLIEFAVFELQPEIFQKVVLGRLQQMTDQASLLDEALFCMHKDLYRRADEVKDLFRLVSDRLPPGPADLGEIKIYLTTLIDWLNTDPWPQHQQLGGPTLAPAAIERKLWVNVPGAAQRRDADADELARQCSRLVVLGGPGSGKTWLAMRTARICAEEALAAMENGAILEEIELPLYTTCSRLLGASGDICEAAVSSALNWIGYLGGPRITKALFRFFTERPGKPTLLVIDSLDEASGASTAHERLRQVDSLKQPWRVVLTSRPSSWNRQVKIEGENQTHQVGELQALRYPDDVESIIDRWFAGDPDRGLALARQISWRPSLQRAATVPLILAFYCIIGGGQGQLPEFRHKLYAQVINRMLRSPWHASSGPLRDVEACRQALRTWAWQAAKDQEHLVSGIGQWEDDVLTGEADLSPAAQAAVDHIAVPQGDPDFDTDQTRRRFVHRSIREHLVAEYVARMPAEEAAEELLNHLWYDPDWEYAAPAALAMHRQRDQVLRLLIHRITGGCDQLPADLAAIDACWEVRRFLAMVASDSEEKDWPAETAEMIGQARLSLAKSLRTLTQIEPGDWPTWDKQIIDSILGRLAVRTCFADAPDLAEAIARLQPTAEQQATARQVLFGLLAFANPGPAWSLARAIARLEPTAGERAAARQVLLSLLTDEPGMAPDLAEAIAGLEPTAGERAIARQALLDRLAETDPELAKYLLQALAGLAVTGEEQAASRQALLSLLAAEADPEPALDLAEAIAGLEPTADQRAAARQTLLDRLAEADPELAEDLPQVVAGLAVTGQEQAVSRQALLSLLAAEADPGLAVALAGTVRRLEPTAGERAAAREALLGLLAAETYPGSARALAKAVTGLSVTGAERAAARQTLLGLLTKADTCQPLVLMEAIARLEPTADQRAAARQTLLDLLTAKSDPGLAPAIATAIAGLEPTADQRAAARQTLLDLLTDQPRLAPDLVGAIARLEPSADQRAAARQTLLDLLATAEDWKASNLTDAIAGLAMTANEEAAARRLLLGMLGRANSSVAPDLARAVARLHPTVTEFLGADGSPLTATPELLAVARQNSPLPAWLVALPLLSAPAEAFDPLE